MDMTTEDMEEMAARENRRAHLVQGIQEMEQARALYDKAIAAVRKAQEAEKKRAEKAAKKIAELQEKANAEHRWLAHCRECERGLMGEFVDPDLISKRDAARAKARKVEREVKKAKGDYDTQARIVEQRDIKEIEGPLRDARGRYKRGKPDPQRPMAQGPILFGKIRNPRYWTSKQEKEHFLSVLADLEAVYVVAQEKLRKADAELMKAQAAVMDAYDRAFRGA